MSEVMNNEKLNEMAEARYPKELWPETYEQYQIVYKDAIREALSLPEVKAMKEALEKCKTVFEQQNFDTENGIIGEAMKALADMGEVMK